MSLGLVLPTRHAWGILLAVVPLCLAGVLTIHVAPAPNATGFLAGAPKQIIFIGVGILAMGSALAIGYQRFGRFANLLFVLCLVLLCVLLVDRWVDLRFVPLRNGARRWIQIKSIQLQPSEIMKIVYVLALAWYLRYRRNYRTLRGLIAPFALTLVPMALIKMQPDLGTVLLFLPVLFVMLFAAGAKGKHLLVIILLGACSLPVFWLKIEKYQRLRIVGMFLQNDTLRTYFEEHPDTWDWFRPGRTTPREWRRELASWASRSGYQLEHSKAAIGTGGMFGEGWGKGRFVEQENLLPERQNDFIFAMIAHQWGWLGAILLMLCYATIVVVGFDIATLTNDPFGRLVAVGMSTLIGVQTLTNLSMTVGLGPITGMTLPFVSQGGSSLVASFICIGLLISVAQRRPMLIANPPFVFDEEAEKYESSSR